MCSSVLAENRIKYLKEVVSMYEEVMNKHKVQFN